LFLDSRFSTSVTCTTEVSEEVEDDDMYDRMKDNPTSFSNILTGQDKKDEE